MSRSTNRNYKKGKPHRDFRKFIVVAEGEREDEYFGFFKGINQRISVEIVEREEGASAVKHLLDRLTTYNYKNGIEPEDFVWFVLDVDRWPREHIDELNQNCEQEENWFLSVSNQCFEVWLFYHLVTEIPAEHNTAKKLKRALNDRIPGGYNRDRFAVLIREAADNASAADPHPDHYFPEKRVSKVYTLAYRLLDFLGNNWKDDL